MGVELHLKMELGIDIHDTGNPLKAAIFSAIFVSIGCALPILPYFIFTHEIAWIVALGLAVVAGVILGIATGCMSGLSGIGVCKTAFRQVFGVALASGAAL